MEEKTLNKDINTEKRILESARKIFHVKGLAGARMQEIADEARINKAMLNYYFRSKDKLFEAVFKDAARDFFPKVFQMVNMDVPLFEKIEKFIEGYLTFLQNNRCIPGFIINELSQNPQRLKEFFKENNIRPPEKFLIEIREAVERKEIIQIEPTTLILNILSLCIFPVVAKPIIETVFNISEEQYNDMIESRKKSAAQFIINAIKVK
ncbi:MAG: TetR/AcrR family transcriptional regulator [Ignavibacteriae bacterium]|nr:TetR/AcrR family transcriptional regulator [Ignavibacteriota bacterium]